MRKLNKMGLILFCGVDEENIAVYAMSKDIGDSEN